MLCECGSYAYVCITRMAVIKVTNDSSRKMVAEYNRGGELGGRGTMTTALGSGVLTTVIELLLLEYYGCGDTEMTPSVWSDNYLKSQMTSSTTYI